MNNGVLLEMKNISKSFPGVCALDDVNLKVKKGEVHAILGENGAGKSTLMKILSGANCKDSGKIFLQGRPIEIQSPLHAQQLGIAMIYQEFNLAPHLSVAENIFIGREPASTVFKFIRKKEIRRDAISILKQLDIELDPDRKVKNLNICQQQITEIAKALSIHSKIFIMDEPTSALMESEAKKLFDIIRWLKTEGLGIIYISHDLDEVFSLADTITVLRDGRCINSSDVNDTNPGKAIRMMVGREISEMFPKVHSEKGDVLLDVRNLSTKNFLRDISFVLRKGEILGISGLLGAGRTELARAIFRADSITGGHIRIEGSEVTLRDIPSAIKAGIGLVPEDRKNQGLFLEKSLMWNISATNLKEFSWGNIINGKKETLFTIKNMEKLGIKASGIDQKVAHLSGGNQQKVVLTKWLSRNPRILILDDPTRGIDVGAKQSIYRIIVELAASGMGIIFISSEMPEVLGISDRILVMAEGMVQGELSRDEATQDRILDLLTCNHEEVPEWEANRKW